MVFSYVVKGIKIKINARFRASRRLRFEATKRIISPEIRSKSFGTFEKQAPGHLEPVFYYVLGLFKLIPEVGHFWPFGLIKPFAKYPKMTHFTAFQSFLLLG